MKYGINVATLGDYANPQRVVELAHAAEAAGWDGLFVWDHLAFAWGVASGDPWVILAAVATVTSKLKLGSMITPIPCRRPYVLANTLATLDVLSKGRMIFGAGLGGVESEFAAFGDASRAVIRAEMLDEGLDIIKNLWSGENVSQNGKHYTIADVTLAPLPVQQPRIPIWIGGSAKPALRRAARWDGWCIGGFDQNGKMVKTPEAMAADLKYIQQHRAEATPFEVAYIGESSPGDTALIQELAKVGVTWWQEAIHGLRGSHETMLKRVQAGPPK